ncbi:hypothetical protein, partial [Algoriphagus sp.]|uniref:hypothetical protein n=1 Tax=Algoriphagus sp. TaxID=1872435 RepID=UPI0025F27F62
SDIKVEVDSSRILEMNEFGVIEVSDAGSSNQGIIELKNLEYYFGDLEEEEKLNFSAALNSISSVMKIKFNEVEKLESASLIFDNKYPETIESDKLYFLTENPGFSHYSNVHFHSGKLNFESSEKVRSGLLPEYILRELINFSGINPLDTETTEKQIASRFLIKEEDRQNRKSGFEILLSGLFIVTFGLERFFSNQRGV